MKNKILMIFIFFVTVLTLFNFVQATEFIDLAIYEEEYKSSEGEKIEGPFINMSNSNTVIDTDVNHSGLLYSNTTMDIFSNLKGVHFIAAGDTLTITGKIDNAIIIAGNVVIEGEVAGDVFISSPGVFIKEGAIINGDVILIADTLNMAGTVNGNLYAQATNLATITGNIGKSLKLKATQVEFDGETVNDLVLLTNSDITEISEKYPNATVKNMTDEQTSSLDIQAIIVEGVKSVIVFGIIAIIILKFSPDCMNKLMDKVKNHPTKTVIAGILFPLAIVAIVTVCMILIVFGMGIIAWPIIIVYAAIIIVAWMLKVLVTGFLVYALISKFMKVDDYKQNKIKNIALLFGSYLVIYLITLIPGVNQYINAAMYMLTIGMLFAVLSKEKKK